MAEARWHDSHRSRFLGRQRFVEVLNRYLQGNLVKNGGILDEIIVVAKTDNDSDLFYLDEPF